MRICIFGAGAIGGYVAAKLAATSEVDLSLVARGPHLEAMRTNGLKLIEDGRESVHKVKAEQDPAKLGPQDYVILSLKAHSVPGIVDAMQPLLGPDTAVVTAQNGVPWWYFYKLAGPHEGKRLASVDPGNRIWERIGPERAIGCVVYPATEVDEPGVIRHVEGDRFPLGEPSNEKSERVLALSKAMVAAGLKAPVRSDIRSDLWVKLWGNLSFNPISALTGATLEEIVGDAETRALARRMMVEAQAIGEALGVRFPVDVDKRIKGAGEVGAHKTSMLQDLERGRPMEIDALVGAVAELGRLTGLATPAIDSVLALVRQLGRLRGCYTNPPG
jgi:2-dehydropantoate 2-reductase